MEVFNKIFDDIYQYESTYDYSTKPMATGKSKSRVLSMLNDEAVNSNYTSEDYKREQMFLKELIANKGNKRINAKLVPPKRPSRRPGEFTEVDFPKVSILTIKQMKLYTYLSEAKKNNRLDPDCVAEYEELERGIGFERDEYQAFAMQQWAMKNHTRVFEIKPSVNSYVDDLWQSRITRVQKMGVKYFIWKEHIPLTFNDNIDSENPVTLKMGEMLCAMGTHNSFVVPPLMAHPREVTYLPTDYCTLSENRDPDYEFLPPVSRDEVVEYLLKESAAFKNDHIVVVLSASGLKAIADSHSFTLPWMLPVTIKEIIVDGNKRRKVVYIDKKLPPKTLTIAERMKWYAKIAARMMMCKSNVTSDEAGENSSTSCNVSEGDECEGNETMDVEDDYNPMSKCKVKRKPVWSAGRREYRVWQIGKETQNHLMKNQVGQIKILLRTKYDGEWKKCKKNQIFTVVPKLDYQCEYGGDKLTTSECIRQWTDLHIRPGSFLKRARINPVTCEFMQLQTLVEKDLLTEMKDAGKYGNPRSIANTLYSITSQLCQKLPGNYLLENSSKLPDFCMLHIECEEKRPKGFVLQECYPWHVSQAVTPYQNAPFIPLDPKFKTANCWYRSVLPLTFPPRSTVNPILKDLPKFVTRLAPKNYKKRRSNNKKKKKKAKGKANQIESEATSSSNAS